MTALIPNKAISKKHITAAAAVVSSILLGLVAAVAPAERNSIVQVPLRKMSTQLLRTLQAHHTLTQLAHWYRCQRYICCPSKAMNLL